MSHSFILFSLASRANITSRINGLDGKFEILKQATKSFPLLAGTQEAATVRATIDAISSLKTYRDDVVHARIGNPRSGTAVTRPKRGGAFEIPYKLKDPLFGLPVRRKRVAMALPPIRYGTRLGVGHVGHECR